MDIAYSVNNVPIRLTEERWGRIVQNKPYMRSHYDAVFRAIEKPTWVLRGYAGAMVGVLSLGRRNYLHVVYREVRRDDGFILTAFLSQKVNRRMIIWPKKS